MRRLRVEAATRLADSTREVQRLIDQAAQAADPAGVVEALGALRRGRGEASLLTDVPEIDDEAVTELLGRLDTSMAELAERADVPLSTMKSWIRRGLARLKKCLEAE